MEDSTAASTPPTQPCVRAIFTDLDGTFLASNHSVSPKNAQTCKRVVQDHGIPIIPATGRSLKSAQGGIGEAAAQDMGLKFFPGVYVQGLMVYGAGGVSDIVHEETLSKNVSRRAVEFWMTHKLKEEFSFIAYCTTGICCLTNDSLTDVIANYQEDVPTPMGCRVDAFDDMSVNKIIIIASRAEIIEIVRKELTTLFGTSVSYTQGIGTMMELLPPGSSKGKGVLKLLEHLCIDVKDTMAIGDAENDLEMLSAAGISVAMGSAPANVRAVSDRVTGSADADGWSDAVLDVLKDHQGGSVQHANKRRGSASSCRKASVDTTGSTNLVETHDTQVQAS